ncbi:hypothetical protein [Flavobacterium sp. W21_SRS_FM6]|uniref:hypothetical protein n=1 Tax=Flavobacterium sp. W21_SRS_FM6 TaxID=3240268 RepID=UPI003F91B4F2
MTSKSNTLMSNDWASTYDRYFKILMRREFGNNNNEIGRSRLILTVLLAARFGLTSPTVIANLYKISRRQSLEHLNKLVKRNLLILVETHRSTDGRIYICDNDGAKFAEQMVGISIPFRRFNPPEAGVNQNSIMHDLMNSHILMRLMHETARHDPKLFRYNGFMTEREFKRQLTRADTRIVDGLIVEKTGEGDHIIAVEIENSFKTKAQRSTILLRYLEAIKAGFYEKVFLISQSKKILDDIKRFHTQLFDELTEVRSAKTKQPLMSVSDVQLLKQTIVYRTKYCDELTEMFYR